MLQRGGLAVLTSSILLPGDLLYCSQHTLRLPLRKKRGEGCLKCSDKKIYRSTLENSPSSKFFPEFLCDKLVKKGLKQAWPFLSLDVLSQRPNVKPVSWWNRWGGGGRGRRKVRLQNAADPKEYPYFAFKTGYSQDHRGL